MKNASFHMWCLVATGRIGFLPDRQRVRAELEQHLNDRYEGFLAQGHDPDDAAKMTLEAMGSASELAPQLAAIHRPFWGYFLRTVQAVLILLLCLSILPIWDYITNLNLRDKPNLYPTYDVYDSDSYGGDTGRTLLHLSQPDVAFSSDGYRFTVTDAVMVREYSESQGKEVTQLYFLVDQRGQLPWSETERYYNRAQYSAVCRLFTAKDSLGNFYYSYAEQSLDNPGLQVVYCQSGLFTCTYACWINDFPAEAEWVDVCYERDGRSFSLRIWLTGGDGA